MWHSGTIAPARQAALLGIRGVAFSAPVTSTELDFDALKPGVQGVLEVLLARADLELVNVNLPERPPLDIQWTRQSVRHYEGSVVPGTDPMGREHFWLIARPMEAPEEGTDRWAVEHGYVSMTPLRLDLTNERQLEQTTSTVRKERRPGL